MATYNNAWKDDKVGIIYGDLAPMALDQHGRFDGKKFTLEKIGRAHV